jgi:hypothetical protein
MATACSALAGLVGVDILGQGTIGAYGGVDEIRACGA